MTRLVNIAPAGDHGLLIELDRSIAAAGLHATAARVRTLDGVLACTVGHSSLYVVFENEPGDITGAVESANGKLQTANRQHKIPVSFHNAPDLDEFLSRTKLKLDDFLANLPRLFVRYLGFRGGFAYLDGWPAEWAMPRRPTSRPVARGSFGIAGGVAGFYPIDTPGGWNILGRTGVPLEYRFAPGDEITMVPTLETLETPAPKKPQREEIRGIDAPFVTRVRAAGWNNIVRGAPVGGPFDPGAAAAANIAVGKSAEAELLEFAQVGPRVTADTDIIVAWYDASGGRTYRVRARETLDIGRIRNGLRGYLAIGGRGELRTLERDDRHVIRTMRGPHDIGLGEIDCEVTPSLDRVGIRMRPLRKIDVSPPADMPSYGMQFGTLQLHPDGSIVAMGPEHPVTGGYLQPMTVLWRERWKLAHLAPGERVRFIAQSP
jgi:allophanate hydrolase subunit 1